MREFIIKKNDAGQRLDKFLSKSVKGLPLSLLYKSIRLKKIKVNRKRAEQNQMLSEGDTVQLFLKEEFFSKPTEDNSALASIRPKLEIVYEDENILLLNKRPGVLVHEDTDGFENTLILHIKAYLYQKGEYNPADEQSFAPALCNRIDRNTGGIVISAKNAEALRLMNEKIRRDEVKKSYYCLLHGIPTPKNATVTAYLRKNAGENKVEISDKKREGFKEIITKYEVLSRRDDISLCRVELVTGRTHQIRAQMAHLGHPLVGDGKYGVNREDKAKGFKYQALYAYRLYFDFKGESGCLSSLAGKTVELAPKDIWFLKDWELSPEDKKA